MATPTTTPTHDEQGRPLLSDGEFHRITMLPDEADFLALPAALQQQYRDTKSWHFQQRMNAEGQNVQHARTSSGRSMQETIDHWNKVKSQQGK